MQPHDDIGRGKFNLGCVLDKATKDTEESVIAEWIEKDVTFEFQQNYFAKKALFSNLVMGG